MEFIEGLRDRLRKRGDGWEKGVRSVTKSLANDSWREICLKKKKGERKNCYKEVQFNKLEFLEEM